MATSLAARGGEALKRGHLDTASWALRPRRSTTAGRTTVRQFTEVRKYQVRDVVGQISTPLLS